MGSADCVRFHDHEKYGRSKNVPIILSSLSFFSITIVTYTVSDYANTDCMCQNATPLYDEYGLLCGSQQERFVQHVSRHVR